ncbi:MAG: protein-export membrane protein SecF [Candidatus Ryanbacteria bacterium RIFCSPHIGHO2_02_FULL_45_43]|uniref:Protein-export membrane protein SecF n=1 Tax=Candidatus Ryanbacteria bacterium RIFCSPHIGHO2_01_45_13 TaxID=1802112 RepID=A0A1G2FU88_9BACT|nr:MAG: protein-export membrane protein SecF [Candidatus Ryanbacteria bacterium RIFCSPHIGHO2_01_45_13]OGZ41526.1 MAG: protein-export membrane protein SecF [Candidatus Ryanbacteria bacterium RIFCSPHIGHO2_01_FULL_44_130]OGZ47993.1 MAG: protein-export membrane protein SecF [Candidatus Ryanbacteria bacterium RIFCSPHIGHO2_02_FULL_45_43]OGZ50129.1 MAG: protein-export membrane protein SecF [Candidatus Ryanbacteria bacterium RIFCSPHIGHO2_12_FULL_44_20]OGZ51131.1 MAG: protein-export membrane protein Sec
MFIIKYRNIFYAVSLLLVTASFAAVIVWGLPLGIDFRGGSLLEVTYTEQRPSVAVVNNALVTSGIHNARVQFIGDKGLLIRTRHLSEQEHQVMIAALQNSRLEGSDFEERRFESIGPVIGKELGRKALIALALALVFILLYIAWAFRKVSHRFSSWKYGMVALVALFHDIIIPTGIFAFLGQWGIVEIDALFVTALLTILGFSIHDTIVVFDRVRENLKKFEHFSFSDVTARSISETIVRSVNTSLTTLLVLLAVFFFGGDSVHYFALALVLGIFFGTYSSIFIASPLLVTLEGFKKNTRVLK